jgi:alkylation response protein AidB-like acyl-CoA dehydrogenase
MNAMLDDERRLLRDSAHTFLRERAPVAHLRRLRDSHDPLGFSRDLWRDFAAQGYSATLVPEAYGGLGLGVSEAGLIAEALGRTLTPSPFFATAVLGAWALAAGGSEAQKAAILPKIAAAETLITLAIDETSKHRPAAIATRAVPAGAGWRLDGAKRFVLDAHVADWLIVAAASGDAPRSGLSLFLIDARAPGVAIERSVMVDAHNAGRVHLENVHVAADAVLGTVGGGAELLEPLLDIGRAVISATLVGIADETFARTLAYLKERRQFDRPIGEFQALQHRAAILYGEIELARALVQRALLAAAADPRAARRTVSQAKARAGRTATLAVQEAVQMHGGMGMTDDLDLGLFMKRARVLEELFGDAGFHTDRAARLGGY